VVNVKNNILLLAWRQKFRFFFQMLVLVQKSEKNSILFIMNHVEYSKSRYQKSKWGNLNDKDHGINGRNLTVLNRLNFEYWDSYFSKANK